MPVMTVLAQSTPQSLDVLTSKCRVPCTADETFFWINKDIVHVVVVTIFVSFDGASVGEK